MRCSEALLALVVLFIIPAIAVGQPAPPDSASTAVADSTALQAKLTQLQKQLESLPAQSSERAGIAMEIITVKAKLRAVPSLSEASPARKATAPTRLWVEEKELRAAAEAGDLEASIKLLKIIDSYFEGSLGRDESSAVASKKAIEQANAIIERGKTSFTVGDGERIRALYSQAASNGNAEANCWLGGLYLEESYPGYDLVKSATFFHKAVELGHVGACIGLAEVLEKIRAQPAGRGDLRRLPPTIQNLESVAMRKEAARRGSLVAMNQLAQQIPSEAQYWYREATLLGDKDAMFALYQINQNTPTEANKWLRRAAAAGHAAAAGLVARADREAKIPAEDRPLALLVEQYIEAEKGWDTSRQLSDQYSAEFNQHSKAADRAEWRETKLEALAKANEALENQKHQNREAERFFELQKRAGDQIQQYPAEARRRARDSMIRVSNWGELQPYLEQYRP